MFYKAAKAKIAALAIPKGLFATLELN